MLQLEDYGFCKKGEGGDYVSNGTMRLGGRRPNNTSGGHLCEGYTHGMNMVIENVRQLQARRRRFLPDRARRQAPAHLRLPRRRLPPGQELRGVGQPGLGQSRHGLGQWSCGAARGKEGKGRRTMEIQATYLGMPLSTRRSRRREPRFLPALLGAQLPSSEVRRVRIAALSADHGLSVVHEPQVGLGAGRGTRARCIPTPRSTTPFSRRSRRIRRISSWWSTSTPRRASPPSTRLCAWSATSRRRTASWHHPTWCAKSASARGSAWCSPTQARARDTAMDDRRGRQAARQAVALSAGVGQARATKGIMHG